MMVGLAYRRQGHQSGECACFVAGWAELFVSTCANVSNIPTHRGQFRILPRLISSRLSTSLCVYVPQRSLG